MGLPAVLEVPFKVPANEVAARGLYVEGAPEIDFNMPLELAARMRTAHAPFCFDHSPLRRAH